MVVCGASSSPPQYTLPSERAMCERLWITGWMKSGGGNHWVKNRGGGPPPFANEIFISLDKF